MIKILSGSTTPIGSTIALVNLCNQFNARGCDSILYGPHRWHLDKCKSGTLADFHPDNDDTLIVHDIRLLSMSDLYNPVQMMEEDKGNWLKRGADTLSRRFSGTPKPRDLKIIYTYQGYSPTLLKRSRLSLLDSLHYASNSLKAAGGINRHGFVCPRFVSDLKESTQKPRKVAGVFGAIRKENLTAPSIEKAIEDGMEQVIIYGYLLDPRYFYEQIEPLARKYPGKIKFAGFIDDIQKIYDSVSAVYCSANKPWSRIKQECIATNTIYHGPEAASPDEVLTNDEIFAIWSKALGL